MLMGMMSGLFPLLRYGQIQRNNPGLVQVGFPLQGYGVSA